MAGFAALFEPDSSEQEREYKFNLLLETTARFKGLEIPSQRAQGNNCTAAKLDAASSLHCGIVHDEKSESWLIAAGTVINIDSDHQLLPLLERLLLNFLKIGIRALDNYDGHFALIIYNGYEKTVSVISDPLGLFSIYYWIDGNKIFISSSALAIAILSNSKPDRNSLEAFLLCGRLDGDRTLWGKVKRLVAATELRITRTKIQVLEYWSPSVDKNISNLSFDDALISGIDTLTNITKIAFRDQGLVWADLTGGFDTRLITTFLYKVGIPFKTYCVGSADSKDVEISYMISQMMGWNYRNINLPESRIINNNNWFAKAIGMGNGHISILNLVRALIGHEEKTNFSRVIASGIGGENLRGYYYLGEGINLGRTTEVNLEHLMDHIFSPTLLKGLLRENRVHEIRSELSLFSEKLFEKYRDYPNTVKLDRFEVYRDAGHGGAYLSSSSGIIRSINPLCFKQIVDFSLSINYQWKLPIHHRMIRSILERENKILASIPTTTFGLAYPIKVGNLFHFMPLWINFLKKADNKVRSFYYDKVLVNKPPTIRYEKLEWYSPLLEFANQNKLLALTEMHTQDLYNQRALENLIAPKNGISSLQGEILDRIITLEMTMRATGTTQ